MCFDLRDGAIVWAEPSFAPYGTLKIADGKLVILDEKGGLVIARATPGAYHELARAKVHDSRCWVMPVLANGRIYAKTNKGELACLDVRAQRQERPVAVRRRRSLDDRISPFGRKHLVGSSACG